MRMKEYRPKHGSVSWRSYGNKTFEDMANNNTTPRPRAAAPLQSYQRGGGYAPGDIERSFELARSKKFGSQDSNGSGSIERNSGWPRSKKSASQDINGSGSIERNSHLPRNKKSGSQDGNGNGSIERISDRLPNRQFATQGGNGNGNIGRNFDHPRNRQFASQGGTGGRRVDHPSGYGNGNLAVNYEGTTTHVELDHKSMLQVLPQLPVDNIKTEDNASTAEKQVKEDESLESERKKAELEKKLMTLQEYQKIFEKKWRPLLALKTTEERKVQVDSQFETMQQLKKENDNDVVFIKLDMVLSKLAQLKVGTVRKNVEAGKEQSNIFHGNVNGMRQEQMGQPNSHPFQTGKPNQYESQDNDDFISSESDRQLLLIK